MDMKLKPNSATKKFDLQDKDGNIVAKSVANLLNPVELLDIVDAPGSLRIEFRTDENGKHRDFTIDAEVLSEPSKFQSSLYKNSYFISYNLVNHLRYYLNEQLQILQSSNAIKYFHKSLGFFEEPNGNKVFLYDKTSTTRGISHYFNEKFKFKEGLRKDYENFLKEEILPYKEMQLALVLGLTSVTASFLNEYADIQTLLLNICGPSSTGKSTSAQFIASLWASPKISNSALVKTFNSTNYARMQSIEGMNGVPIIFDDATTAPGVKRSDLIYEITQGESRSRMTDYGKNVKQGLTWSGLCLITSETPILSDAETRQGSIARVIDTNNITWTQDSGHAERIKRSIMNCYGHIAPIFVGKFQSLNQNDIIVKFQESLQEVFNGIKDVDNLSNRIANKLAVIHLTSKLVKELLDYDLNVNEILELLISFDQEDVQDRHIAKRAIEQIKYYVQRHQQKFRKKANGCLDTAEKGELLGVMEFYQSEVHISIPAQTVKEILAKVRIYEYETILKYWGDNKYIRKQSKRNTRNIKALSSRAITFIFEPSEDEALVFWPPIHEYFANPKEPEPVVLETDNKEEIDKISLDGDSHDA